MSTPKGWPTQEKDQRLVPQFATVEPVHTLQHGLSVLSHQYVYEVGTDAAEAGSSEIAIVATAHLAQAGDVVRLTSGALSGREIKVYETSVDLITLAEELPSAIAAGVTFQILRHKYPLVEPTGETKITGTLTATFSEEAVAADGGALPAKVKVAGGYDGTNVQVIKTDANGELQVDVLSSALPTGAATASNQTSGSAKTQITNGSGTPVDVLSLGTAVTSANVGLVTNTVIHGLTTGGGGGYIDIKVTPSGALTVDATVSSSALPAGAATEATLSALNGKVTACNTGAVTISSSALPAGAATETTLSALNTKIPAQGQALMAASVPVVIASNQTAIPVSGSFSAAANSVVDLLDANILDTSSTNIPGSASSPVQVVASLAATVKALQLLDTTGAFVGVYVGGVGSEVLKLVMGPGSDQTIEHAIPSGSRVSLKRLDSTTAVSSGIVAINFLG